MPLDRREIVLAAMAAGGTDATYLPVQMQKLLFLIDREVPAIFNGPHFNFKPYDYGPFDRNVYDCLDLLSLGGAVEINSNGRYRSYRLSSSGYEIGSVLLNNMSPDARDYLQRISQWIRGLNFQQLVTAIYARFPDMKAKSVFR